MEEVGTLEPAQFERQVLKFIADERCNWYDFRVAPTFSTRSKKWLVTAADVLSTKYIASPAALGPKNSCGRHRRAHLHTERCGRKWKRG